MAFSPRTLSLFVAAIALLDVSLASAEEPIDAQPATWTVQVDPLTTALGYVHVQIERRLSKSFSVYAGPHALLFSGILAEDDEDHRGLGAEVGLRWFLRSSDSAPAGFWLQTRGVLARVTKDGEAEPGGYVSALGGYTKIIGGRWVVAGGLGIQYIHYSVNGVGTEGVLPAAHTAVGFAF